MYIIAGKEWSPLIAVTRNHILASICLSLQIFCAEFLLTKVNQIGWKWTSVMDGHLYMTCITLTLAGVIPGVPWSTRFQLSQEHLEFLHECHWHSSEEPAWVCSLDLHLKVLLGLAVGCCSRGHFTGQFPSFPWDLDAPDSQPRTMQGGAVLGNVGQAQWLRMLGKLIHQLFLLSVYGGLPNVKGIWMCQLPC